MMHHGFVLTLQLHGHGNVGYARLLPVFILSQVEIFKCPRLLQLKHILSREGAKSGKIFHHLHVVVSDSYVEGGLPRAIEIVDVCTKHKKCLHTSNILALELDSK